LVLCFKNEGKYTLESYDRKIKEDQVEINDLKKVIDTNNRTIKILHTDKDLMNTNNLKNEKELMQIKNEYNKLNKKYSILVSSPTLSQQQQHQQRVHRNGTVEYNSSSSAAATPTVASSSNDDDHSHQQLKCEINQHVIISIRNECTTLRAQLEECTHNMNIMHRTSNILRNDINNLKNISNQYLKDIQKCQNR
jgi:hypothetical protein